ncbi:hypothetical protein SALBM135S_01688 [Streptomyces alboniger]
MFFDQVAEEVELLLPQRGEAGVGRGDEAASGRPRHLGEEAAPETVALQRPVPVRAPHLADPAAVEERLAARDLGHAVMDLVPLDRFPEGLADRTGEGFLAGEPHPHRQQPESRHGALPGLHVVLDVLAEDLEAAADPEHGAPLGGAAGEGVGEAALAQPPQGAHGPAGARHDHEVGVDELLGPVHEPHDDARLRGQRVHVREVGHQRHRAHGDPRHVVADRRRDHRLADRAAQRDPQAVLLVDAEPVLERQHAVRAPAGEAVQHVQARFEEERRPELVDEVSGDQLLVGRAQQRRRPEERREHPAPVDVPDHQDGEAGRPALCPC